MSQIIPSLLLPELAEDDAYNLINTLPLSYQDFAERSGLYNRMYGVLSGLLKGDSISLSFVANNCVRTELWRTLIQVTEETESYVGFNLSPRYHYEEIAYPYNGRFQALWPGISAINVAPSWSTITGYDAIAISAYTEENVSVALEASVPVATVAMATSPNPNNIYLRNRDNLDGAYAFEESSKKYPYRSGTDWKVGINTSQSNWNPGDDVSVQNREFVYVTVATPDTALYPTGASVYPVYPGTNQIIPEARPRTVSGGNTTFTFFLHALVDPAFFSEDPAADFITGHFYKLLETIELRALEEATQLPTVKHSLGQEELTYTGDDQPTLRVDYGQDGIIQIERAQSFLADAVAEFTEEVDYCAPEHIKIGVWYKTHPTALSQKFSSQVTTVKNAMMYKTAAELPVEDCGCGFDESESNFIVRNQQAGSEILSLYGTPVNVYKYGNLLGQMRYAEAMNTVLRYQRDLRL